MLGPLPKLYRVLVSISAVALFVALGTWLAFTLPIEVVALTGAGIGAGLGLIIALLLLHDSHTNQVRPQRIVTRWHRH